MTIQTRKPRIVGLLPFGLFVGIFLVSTLALDSRISPLFAALAAVAVALCTFSGKMSLNEKMALFVEGAAQPTVIAMILIFIFASVFTHIMELIGGVSAAVQWGTALVPTSLILPGFFVITGLFATAVGSSMGTIAAFMPIGVALADTLGVSPAFMAGIVINGAMLGDNLSFISDTTIAATQSIGVSMKEKFKENVRLVIPAFIATVAVLAYMNHSITVEPSTIVEQAGVTPLVLLPYGVILGLALLGIDVIAVLIVGVLSAIGIGMCLGHFSGIEATQMLLEGFSVNRDIHEVLILSLMVAGLAHLAEYNGGIAYILSVLEHRVKRTRGVEAVISIVMFLVNAAVAINTVAILIVAPVAKVMGRKGKISKARLAALLDVVSCACQGLVPYTPQLLLAASIAGISSIAIIPYLYYQAFILLVVASSIVIVAKNDKLVS